jgi:hypothetical protein
MSFEPETERDSPDVRGTIWLDARTFELRLVEFRYTRLPSATSNRNIGGEVHFTRLPSGAWIVERWFIRIPRYNNRPTTRSTGVPGVAPVVEFRLAGLVEEGGNRHGGQCAATPSGVKADQPILSRAIAVSRRSLHLQRMPPAKRSKKKRAVAPAASRGPRCTPSRQHGARGRGRSTLARHRGGRGIRTGNLPRPARRALAGPRRVTRQSG